MVVGKAVPFGLAMVVSRYCRAFSLSLCGRFELRAITCCRVLTGRQHTITTYLDEDAVSTDTILLVQADKVERLGNLRLFVKGKPREQQIQTQHIENEMRQRQCKMRRAQSIEQDEMSARLQAQR